VGKQADIAEKYIVKGSMLGIQAKLTNRIIKDAEGKERTEYQLLVQDMLLLGGKRADADTTKTTAPTNRILSKAEVEENLPF
jgi:single-stranded DNA-binding protein